MKSLFWNVRGINKLPRRKQVREYIAELQLDYVGLQETKKHDFSDKDLNQIGGQANFSWKWIPAKGLSSGILVGCNLDSVEMEEVLYGSYHIATSLRHRLSNFRWMQITVYGPANHGDSAEFLEELTNICRQTNLPVVFGGDFNLVRSDQDKNNDNLDTHLMNLFNSFIERCCLKEIKKGGPKFT